MTRSRRSSSAGRRRTWTWPPRSRGSWQRCCCPRRSSSSGGLLDALAGEGFAQADLDARTQIFHAFCEQDPDAKLGLLQLKALTLLFFYALPDEAGPQPELGGDRLPGPELGAPVPCRRAEDAGRRRGVGAVGNALRRRLRDRLRRRRRRGRRRVRQGGQERARARDGRLPQRVGLQAARAARLPGALLRRRPRRHGVGIDRDPGRPDARRRDRRQLHELRPHARLDPRRVGQHGLEGLDDAVVRLRPHGGGARAHRREHGGHQAERDPPAADRRPATRSATSTARSGATPRSTTTPSSAATARWAASRAASARR